MDPLGDRVRDRTDELLRMAERLREERRLRSATPVTTDAAASPVTTANPATPTNAAASPVTTNPASTATGSTTTTTSPGRPIRERPMPISGGADGQDAVCSEGVERAPAEHAA